MYRSFQDFLNKTFSFSRIVFAFVCIFSGAACSPLPKDAAPAKSASVQATTPPAEKADIPRRLDSMAAAERSSGFRMGMGLSESSLREQAGDYPGAVLAAFKELLYARSLGAISDADAAERLRAAAEAFEQRRSENGPRAAIEAARAAERYLAGDWKAAGTAIDGLFPGDEVPDSFARWLSLSCALEKGDAPRAVRAAYAAIRARYERFPEYWYRAARSEPSGAAAADAAERCVVLAPKGPFAEESRGIIAESVGLKKADGRILLTRSEIESLVREAAATRNPNILERVFPLLGLPDNPYTLYALGSLRGLSADVSFRSALASAASSRSGRAAERLRYASGN